MQQIVDKKGHRVLPLLALALALGLVFLVAIVQTQAVHDDNLFELDVDASGAVCPDPNGPATPFPQCSNADPFDEAAAGYDWDSICEATNLSTNRTIRAISPRPTGVGQSSCEDDWPLPDNTRFSTGSKDIGEIAPTGGFVGAGRWQCTETNNVLEKDEIMNAYSALMTNPADDHDQLYFGFERASNNGTGFVGFWFVQDEVDCVGPTTGSNNWSGGAHVPGDVLIISDFESGGRVSAISVLEWNPNNTLADPDCTALTLVPDPTAGPLCLKAGGPLAAADCSLALGGDEVCAGVNVETLTTEWWNEPNKPPCNPSKGGTNAAPGTTNPCTVPLPFNQLYEGGVDLTSVICPGGTPCDLPCFSTFIAETRSSAEFTADLKDYVRGNFEVCGSKAGVKFHDLNADGDQDAGEPNLSGWTINLYKDANGNGVLDSGEADCVPATECKTDVTDSTGYKFIDLQPGQYIVCEVVSDQDSDWQQSLPAAGSPPTPPATGPADCTVDSDLGDVGYAFTIEVVEEETGNDFGNFKPATKEGRKFEDLQADGFTGDGVNDDTDPGLEGWTIFIYNDVDGDGSLSAGDTFEGSVDTDSSGNYSFTVDPGKYIVCEEAQGLTSTDTWTQSYPASGADCSDDVNGDGVAAVGYAIDLESDELDDGNDFGNYLPGHKRGIKFNDYNANGSRDAGEPVISGVTIKAYADDNPFNGSLDAAELGAGAVATGTTNGSGAYDLTLNPGDYIICEVLPAGFVQSAPANTKCAAGQAPNAANLGPGGHAVTITSGSDHPGNNFGNRQGSIIIRKEAKDARTECVGDGPGCHDLLCGATFLIEPNPLTGVLGSSLSVTDVCDPGTPDGNDEFGGATGDGLICIDNVVIGPSYKVTETDAPDNYQIPTPDNQPATPTATNCATRGTSGTPNVTFDNIPLSEIEVLCSSLAGPGVTVCSIVCSDGAGAITDPDPRTTEEGADDPALDDTDETFTDLIPGTYTCEIVIDP